MCVRRRTARACNNKHNLPTRTSRIIMFCLIPRPWRAVCPRRVVVSYRRDGPAALRLALVVQFPAPCRSAVLSSRKIQQNQVLGQIERKKSSSSSKARNSPAHARSLRRADLISLIHRRDRLRRMRQSLRRGCAFCRDVTRHGQGYPSQLALRLFRTNLFLDR